MANSNLITDLKLSIIKELINDKTLFYAIDSPEVKDIIQADKLVYKHIFPYHRIDFAITEMSTLITLQVHIQEPKTWDKKWIIPVLEIWVYSHNEHMKVENIPEVSDNRNDYIAKLLDKKLNGRSSFGNSKDPQNNICLYGSLDLTLNEEGVTQQGVPYRHLMFKTKDLNNSPCNEEGW